MRKFLLLLLVVCAQAHSYYDREPLVLTYGFSWDGRDYNAHLVLPAYLGRIGLVWNPIHILQHEHLLGRPIPSRFSAEELISVADDFAIGQYWERKLLQGARGRRMERALRKREAGNKGRSAYAIIASADDLEDVQCIARVDSVTEEHPQLDVESRLLGRGLDELLPRSSGKTFRAVGDFFSMKREPVGKQQNRFKVRVSSEVEIVNAGRGKVEIKEVVKSRKSEDFLPLAYGLLESHGATVHSGDPGEFSPGIATYWLETDGVARRNHWIDNGWHVYRKMPNPDMPGSTTYVMRISRKNYKARLEEKIMNRIGRPIVIKGDFKLDPYQWKNRRCQDLLGWKGMGLLFNYVLPETARHINSVWRK